jgi:hypothetical protein
MSIASKAAKKAGSSSNRPDYVASFLRDTHRLVARGYARMTPASFKGTIEEVITEKLVEAINAAIQSPGAESWMHRYHAVDNLPLSHPEKSGKKRPRVDIEITNVRAGPHPQFHFEAKRLGRGYPVGQYVGRKGLGCIIHADYARDHDDAGMLGYVQTGTCDDWGAKIEKKLMGDGATHCLLPGSSWRQSIITKELSHTFRTQHDRPSLSRPVDVHHTLLLFQ